MNNNSCTVTLIEKLTCHNYINLLISKGVPIDPKMAWMKDGIIVPEIGFSVKKSVDPETETETWTWKART